MPATLEKLLTPPNLPVKDAALSAEDKAAVAEIAAHFNKADYTAPDGENKTTRSPLILREFMFFVSMRHAPQAAGRPTRRSDAGVSEALARDSAWNRGSSRPRAGRAWAR